MSDPIEFLVEINVDSNSNPTWIYDGTDITNGSLSVEFSTTSSGLQYTVTVNGDSQDPVPTTEDSVKLNVSNESGTSQTVTVGADEASMSVPLVDEGTIAIVGAVLMSSSVGLSTSLSISGDPVFSVSPAKPSTTNGTPTAPTSGTITWNGSDWGSTTEVIANSSGALNIVNGTNEPVRVELDNGQSSMIRVPIAIGARLPVSFGSSYTLAGGSLAIEGSAGSSLALAVAPPLP